MLVTECDHSFRLTISRSTRLSLQVSIGVAHMRRVWMVAGSALTSGALLLLLGCGGSSAPSESMPPPLPPPPPAGITQLSSDPFTNPESQHATEVEAGMASFGSTLPLRRASALREARMRKRILHLTEGVTVRVCRLLEEATVQAIGSGGERIELAS